MKQYSMNKTGLIVFVGLIAFALYDLALVTFGGVGSRMFFKFPYRRLSLPDAYAGIYSSRCVRRDECGYQI